MYKPEFYEELVISLNNKYNTRDKLIDFLMKLDTNLSGNRDTFHNPIISSWFNINPDLFILVKENHELWVKVPERFKESINLVLSEFDMKYIKKTAEEIFSELPQISTSKLNSFLTSLGRTSIKRETLKDYLNKIIVNSSLNIRIMVINSLDFIFKDDADSIAEIMYNTISKVSELDHEMIRSLMLIFLEMDPEKVNKKTLKKLRNDLFEKLILVPLINYEIQYILNFIFDSNDTFFRFIEYRIKHFYAAKGESYYNPLPSDVLIILTIT